jgi:hypothetical protein
VVVDVLNMVVCVVVDVLNMVVMVVLDDMPVVFVLVVDMLPIACARKSVTENDAMIGTEKAAPSTSFLMIARLPVSTDWSARSSFSSFINSFLTQPRSLWSNRCR